MSCIGLWPIKKPKNINKACYSLIPLFFCWFRIRVNPSSRIRSVVDRHYKYIKKYNNTIHRVHSHKCYHIAYCESHKKLCKYLQITFNPPPWSQSMLFLSHRLRWHAHSWKKKLANFKKWSIKEEVREHITPKVIWTHTKEFDFSAVAHNPICWHMSAEIILICTRHNYGYLEAIENPLLHPYTGGTLGIRNWCSQYVGRNVSEMSR